MSNYESGMSGLGLDMLEFQGMELDPRYPVLQKLERDTDMPWSNGVLDAIVSGKFKRVRILVIGETSGGKLTTASELATWLFEDPNQADKIARYEETIGQPLTKTYFNTGTELVRASKERPAVLNFGKQSKEDCMFADAKGIELIKHMNSTISTPSVEFYELVAVGHPSYPLGYNIAKYLIEDARNNPDTMVKVAFLIGQREVAERSLAIREGVANAQSDEEATSAIENGGMQLDIEFNGENRILFSRSHGDRASYETVVWHEDRDAVRKQNSIRKYTDLGLPPVTRRELSRDDYFRQYVMSARAEDMLRRRLKMSPADVANHVLIGINEMITDLAIPVNYGYMSQWKVNPFAGMEI